MKKVIKNVKLLLIFVFSVCIVIGGYFLISNNLTVKADSVDYLESKKQDEEILKYYHKATIDENFIDNEVVVIFKNSYSNMKEITFDEFKIVENVCKLSSIKYGCNQKITKHQEKIIFDEAKNHMITLELETRDKGKMLEVIGQLQNLDMVLVAEPNYVYEVENDWIPNDENYSFQWGLKDSYGIYAEQAWDITRGNSSIKVGVMESGIDMSHKDLIGRVFDGNTTSGDDTAHGTHVAGIIGAIQNTYGICGVANTSMYLLSNSSSQFANSLRFASENNIKIINASFGYRYSDGTYVPYNAAHYNALASYNGLFVATAGNETTNIDSKKRYPASYDLPNVITIGSIDSIGEISYFSNYGKTTVDIFAPGDNILSSYPNDYCTGGTKQTRWGVLFDCECVWSNQYNNSGTWEWVPNGTDHYTEGYHYMSGTSMAAPFVTGVAALLLSTDNTLTGADLKQIICDNVDKDSRLTNYCVTGGRLNAYKALNRQKYKLTLVNDTGWTETKEIRYGDKIPTVIAPTKANYEFEGYYTGQNGAGTKYVGTKVELINGLYTLVPDNSTRWFGNSDLTLYAKWTPLKTDYTYGCYYSGGGGEAFSTGKIHLESGKEATLTAPEINGYTFKNWVVNDDNFANGDKYKFTLHRSAATGEITIRNYKGGSALTADGYINAIYEKNDECIAKGTLITLADGSQKAVEDLIGNETLLVWNLYTGAFDTAPILFIDGDAECAYQVINLYFSDGTEVNVISEHAFWDFDLNEYVFLGYDAENYIGHWFNKRVTDGGGNVAWTKVQLTDVVVREEVTTAYSPVTYGHLCYYVNGMLSMPGATEGLINIFSVDGENMKIDEAKMQADIEEYGLYSYEEFAEIYPVTEEIFNAFGGQYLKVSIGKGLTDIEKIGGLIDRYSQFLG